MFDKEKKILTYSARSSAPIESLIDLGSLVSITDDNVTSLKLQNSKKIKAGTLIRIYRKRF